MLLWPWDFPGARILEWVVISFSRASPLNQYFRNCLWTDTFLKRHIEIQGYSKTFPLYFILFTQDIDMNKIKLFWTKILKSRRCKVNFSLVKTVCLCQVYQKTGRDTVQGAEVGESWLRSLPAPRRSPRPRRLPSLPSLPRAWKFPAPGSRVCLATSPAVCSPRLDPEPGSIASVSSGRSCPGRSPSCAPWDSLLRGVTPGAEGRPPRLPVQRSLDSSGARGGSAQTAPEQATAPAPASRRPRRLFLSSGSARRLFKATSKRPGKRPAPLAPNAISHTLFSPSPEDLVQETGRRSGTHFTDSDPHPPCTSSVERLRDWLPGPTLGAKLGRPKLESCDPVPRPPRSEGGSPDLYSPHVPCLRIKWWQGRPMTPRVGECSSAPAQVSVRAQRRGRRLREMPWVWISPARLWSWAAKRNTLLGQECGCGQVAAGSSLWPGTGDLQSPDSVSWITPGTQDCCWYCLCQHSASDFTEGVLLSKKRRCLGFSLVFNSKLLNILVTLKVSFRAHPKWNTSRPGAQGKALTFVTVSRLFPFTPKLSRHPENHL